MLAHQLLELRVPTNKLFAHENLWDGHVRFNLVITDSVLFHPVVSLFNGLETTRLDLAFGLQAFGGEISRFAVRARLAPKDNYF